MGQNMNDPKRGGMTGGRGGLHNKMRRPKSYHQGGNKGDNQSS